MLKVSIKRFDTSLPLPEYKTEGAAAIDLYVRKDILIPARGIEYAPLNIALQLPANCWALLAARSSLHKKGLMLANGIGVGDFDFRGDGDEYKAALYNFTDTDVFLEQGERIVQLLIMKRENVKFTLVESFAAKDRGGFGSTGSK